MEAWRDPSFTRGGVCLVFGRCRWSCWLRLHGTLLASNCLSAVYCHKFGGIGDFRPFSSQSALTLRATTKRALGHGREANEAGRWRVYATGVRLELGELKSEVAQLKSLEMAIGRILGEDTAEPGLQLWVNK